MFECQLAYWRFTHENSTAPFLTKGTNTRTDGMASFKVQQTSPVPHRFSSIPHWSQDLSFYHVPKIWDGQRIRGWSINSLLMAMEKGQQKQWSRQPFFHDIFLVANLFPSESHMNILIFSMQVFHGWVQWGTQAPFLEKSIYKWNWQRKLHQYSTSIRLPG